MIKREVRNNGKNITIEITNLGDGKYLIVEVNGIDGNVEIKSRLTDLEEVKKLKESEIWKSSSVLEKEELEPDDTKRDKSEEERIDFHIEYEGKKYLKNEVTIQNRSSTLVDIVKTSEDGKSVRSMIKFDEKDGILIKRLEDKKKEMLNIPRGIIPLKNHIIKNTELLDSLHPDYRFITQLRGVDTSRFLANVVTDELLHKMLNSWREAPVSVSTMIYMKEYETDAWIVSISNGINSIHLSGLSESNKYPFEIKCYISAKLKFLIRINEIGEARFINLINACLAHIGLGLDEIDEFELRKYIEDKIEFNKEDDDFISVFNYELLDEKRNIFNQIMVEDR